MGVSGHVSLRKTSHEPQSPWRNHALQASIGILREMPVLRIRIIAFPPFRPVHTVCTGMTDPHRANLTRPLLGHHRRVPEGLLCIRIHHGTSIVVPDSVGMKAGGNVYRPMFSSVPLVSIMTSMISVVRQNGMIVAWVLTGTQGAQYV